MDLMVQKLASGLLITALVAALKELDQAAEIVARIHAVSQNSDAVEALALDALTKIEASRLILTLEATGE